jgi:aconitase B
MEMPGCSLCMGNQAQIRKGSTAISTSTRNFPNRLGIDTRFTWVPPNWPPCARWPAGS